MNSYQTSKLASLKLIVFEAHSHQQTADIIPAFAKGIDTLDEITKEIETLGVEQAKNLTGITETKNDVLEEVIDYLLDVSGAMYSYAGAKGDKTLQAKVNFTHKNIDRVAHGKVIDAATIVLEEAQKVPAEELAELGITADELAHFAAALAQLKPLTTGKREAVIETAGHTNRIAELFDQAADLKKNTLDRLATQFARKDSDFYNKYKAAASVIHRHGPKKPTSTPEHPLI